jgi:hypothetical protein
MGVEFDTKALNSSEVRHEGTPALSDSATTPPSEGTTTPSTESTTTPSTEETTAPRRQPWRELAQFENIPDKVHVTTINDMHLFGNHVNAHS